MKSPSLRTDKKQIKFHDSYFLIQYFDFVRNGQKHFSRPDPLPDLYIDLFSILNSCAKHNKTLSQQSTYLFMKEAYDTCTLVLHSTDPFEKQTTILFRHEFSKDEWTVIEDLLLNAGLAVFKRNEKRFVRYEFQSPHAQCELRTKNSHCSFTIQARDEQTIYECLKKLGKSIDDEYVTI